MLAVASLTALASCASTSLAESWVTPSLTTMPRFEKVFVAYLGGDASAQRSAEDALAERLERTEVVKCYALFPDALQLAPGGAELDPAKVKSELRALGCDGAVVMRLSRVEQELSWSPSTYPAHYRSFGGYWGAAYPSAMDVRTDEIVHVETNVYSLADDKLLYAARSETFNPGSAAGMVGEIAAAIAEDLEEKGLSRGR
jgi:hypothetical protein